MTREGVVARVAKLLALASEQGGGTEAERDLAAERAQSLMLKHRISEHDLAGHAGREALPGVEREMLGMFKQGSMWQQHLYHVVGAPIGVDAIYWGRLAGKWVALVGRPDAIAYTKTMVEWLVPQLELECAAALAADKQERSRLYTLMGAGGFAYNTAEIATEVMAFKKSFFDFAVERIGDRLAAAARKEPGTDLVRSDEQAKEEFYGDKKPKLKSRTQYEGAGMLAGHEAGGRADLNPGRRVGSAENRRIEEGR